MEHRSINRDLAHEIAFEVANMIEESDAAYSGWWKICTEIIKECEKLMDRYELIADPVHKSIAESLIRDGMQSYNRIIAVFINGGLDKHQEKRVKRYTTKIQVIQNALKDNKSND